MLWGCFSRSGVAPLVQIEGNMDSVSDILEKNMFPHRRKNMVRKCIFQQDNDPKHTSSHLKKLFADKKIKFLDFPSRSPDLNPTGHIWYKLDRRVCRRSYSRIQRMVATSTRAIAKPCGFNAKQMCCCDQSSEEFLLKNTTVDVVKKGAITDAADKFHISRRIARCIWQRGRQSLENGSMLITKLIPAINAKWSPGPRTGRIQVSVQQDNARPHIAPYDPTWMDAAATSGITLELVCQPPNSLDMNVLDLGYFGAIQSLQHQSAPQTIEELIAAIETAFSQLTRDKLNNVFLTLQFNLNEIMKVNGGNNYKIPHMQKAQLDHLNILPSRLECLRNIYDEATVALQR
ncbi:hypothetical protein ANN_03178 [Periplaneta americana]|uniref:Tc1-like transposase DDE domain-containing protein n=1 Tax=Periplaneta americana TaxID=6978 RepID=A0ABQ8TYF0_PERAM|nr:hypothetical protein ANN_03178 [Periplaneta americana]